MNFIYLNHLVELKFFVVCCIRGEYCGLEEWGFLEPFYPSPPPYNPHLPICFRVYGDCFLPFITKKDIHRLSLTPTGGSFQNPISGFEYTIISDKQFVSDSSRDYCEFRESNDYINIDRFDLFFDMNNPKVIRTW